MPGSRQTPEEWRARARWCVLLLVAALAFPRVATGDQTRPDACKCLKRETRTGLSLFIRGGLGVAMFTGPDHFRRAALAEGAFELAIGAFITRRVALFVWESAMMAGLVEDRYDGGLVTTGPLVQVWLLERLSLHAAVGLGLAHLGEDEAEDNIVDLAGVGLQVGAGWSLGIVGMHSLGLYLSVSSVVWDQVGLGVSAGFAWQYY